MNNNKSISITTGASRKATYWKRADMLWTEFIVRIQTPIRSPESYDEYLKFSKSKQDELKDVGGFVGGTFSGTRRKTNAVEGRDLITLDLDNIPAGKTQDILRRVDGLGCAAAVYSTRKHAEQAPRMRVIIPLDMAAEPDEYEPVARKLASYIGIEYCDPTTFETARLMYWPSVCNGAPYVCEVYDKPFCSKFGMLEAYIDWTDMSSWPVAPGETEIIRKEQTRAQDPLVKKGIVGAFCRTYTVSMAIARYLPGVYEETDTPGRLTYAGGSTTGGAVLYQDDRFLYSHHATDPVSGQLVNAWDLVRIHKFGDQDDSIPANTSSGSLPSYKAMQALAMDDDSVRALIALEKQERAKEIFGKVETVPQPEPSAEKEKRADDWISKLRVDGSGNYEKTINNIRLIIENDERLAGKIATDMFSSLLVVLAPLPWDEELFEGHRRWGEKDHSGIKWFLEEAYHIKAKESTEDALTIAAARQKINTVKIYLDSLTWDGTPRLDTLFIDYLGAEDNAYTRAVARKTLCAACARAVINRGVKFDYMPIIIGKQGIGKSTLLAKLGKDWFSDSLVTFEGKEAAEMLQNTWINEIGELTAMSHHETNAVKQFLSKTKDIYRPSYGHVTQEYTRRCVFIGTSNHDDVLKDKTGNRRFWPIDTQVQPATKDVWRDLPGEVDQIWAEAYFRFQLGEPLYLSPEAESFARKVQSMHEEYDDWSGLIEDWLRKPVPKNWDDLSLASRRSYWAGALQMDKELVPRDKVCAREIYYECLGRTDASDTRIIRRINTIMLRMSGWERNKTSLRFGPHGKQRGFEKIQSYLGNGEWA